MINKKFLKEYINDQEVLPKIDLVLSISEQDLEIFLPPIVGTKIYTSIQMWISSTAIPK